MKREEIMDKLEAYVLMKTIFEDKPTWKVRSGESFHEGIKINNFIKVIEQKKYRFRWQAGSIKNWDTYLEILYTDSFVTLNLFLRSEQKKVYKQLREFYMQNRDVARCADANKFTVRFEDHERFDEFFKKYILGDNVCSLI